MCRFKFAFLYVCDWRNNDVRRVAGVTRFKFAVLIVCALRNLRYRRIAMYASDLLFAMKFARP